MPAAGTTFRAKESQNKGHVHNMSPPGRPAFHTWPYSDLRWVSPLRLLKPYSPRAKRQKRKRHQIRGTNLVAPALLKRLLENIVTLRNRSVPVHGVKPYH